MQIGNDAEIFLEDGLLALARMEDASVDHIFSDPPYAAKTHKNAKSGSTDNGKVVNVHSEKHDIVDFGHWETETFLDFCKQAVRVARRWVILTCDLQHMAAAVYLNTLPIVRVGCFTKPNPAPQFTGDRPAQGWEAVLILHRPGAKEWNGGGLPATWHMPVVHGEYPTQKPLPLYMDFLAKFTNPGDLALDPLMGSGTMGVACIRSDRRFIGYEIRPEAFAIAERRIRHEASQLKLFT